MPILAPLNTALPSSLAGGFRGGNLMEDDMTQFDTQEDRFGGILIRDWRAIDTNTRYLQPGDDAEQFRKDTSGANPEIFNSLCAEYFD